MCCRLLSLLGCHLFPQLVSWTRLLIPGRVPGYLCKSPSELPVQLGIGHDICTVDIYRLYFPASFSTLTLFGPKYSHDVHMRQMLAGSSTNYCIRAPAAAKFWFGRRAHSSPLRKSGLLYIRQGSWGCYLADPVVQGIRTLWIWRNWK